MSWLFLNLLRTLRKTPWGCSLMKNRPFLGDALAELANEPIPLQDLPDGVSLAEPSEPVRVAEQVQPGNEASSQSTLRYQEAENNSHGVLDLVTRPLFLKSVLCGLQARVHDTGFQARIILEIRSSELLLPASASSTIGLLLRVKQVVPSVAGLRDSGSSALVVATVYIGGSSP